MTARMLVGALLWLAAILLGTVTWPLLRIQEEIKRAADALERLEDERD